jgi:serine/threonine protein kinase
MSLSIMSFSYKEHQKEGKKVHVVTEPSDLYRLQEQVGDGKTGKVYKAIHPVHGMTAVKVFRSKYAYNLEHELSFLRKMQCNKHFVTVYETWYDDEFAYMAMELLDGTLLDLIEQGLQNDEVLQLTKQLVTALAQLHANQIVHFDLKPENIGFVWMSDGTILLKILDFGMSETFHTVFSYSFQQRVNRGELLLTSRPYASYEAIMLDHVQPHTEKCDVWALGAIVAEMISGMQSFPDVHEENTKEDNEALFQTGITNALDFRMDNETIRILRRIMEACLKIKVCERVYSHELLAFFP